MVSSIEVGAEGTGFESYYWQKILRLPELGKGEN